MLSKHLFLLFAALAVARGAPLKDGRGNIMRVYSPDVHGLRLVDPPIAQRDAAAPVPAAPVARAAESAADDRVHIMPVYSPDVHGFRLEHHARDHNEALNDQFRLFAAAAVALQVATLDSPMDNPDLQYMPVYTPDVHGRRAIYYRRNEAASTDFIHTHELYEHCLTYLVRPEVSSVDIGTLARLACTSKATSELALDILWRNLRSPSPILRLLPADACALVQGTYVLTRPLVETDFSLFDKYAHRVRIVDFSDFKRNGMGCDLFAHLKIHRDPIFPRLLAMNWHPSIKFNTVGAFHLISPGVPAARLSVTIWDSSLPHTSPTPDPSGIAVLLAQPWGSWIPDVRSLRLEAMTFYFSTANIFGGLRALKNLQHLFVGFTVGPDILAHLACLPNLLALHLWEEDEGCMDRVKQTVDEHRRRTGQRSFPALEKLRITQPCEYSELETLFGLITSSALHTVAFVLGDCDSVDLSFLHLITGPDTSGSLERRRSLRHIEFEISPPEPGSDVSPLPSTVLDPLYACPNLTTVYFRAAMHLADDDIARIASSWPRLQTLDARTGVQPAVHLDALPALAAHCPRLHELRISVDARGGPRGGAAVHPPSHALQTLELFGSPVRAEDAGPVTQFLNHAFPRLAYFDGTLPDPYAPEHNEDAWETVRNALPGVDWEWKARRAVLSREGI
ncbi:hypothetical protein FB451DRAFT_1563371 [Mycena latifolia]|nr:hypothetical protein FB451DRAFT_1563371 [Mycena latifolia]